MAFDLNTFLNILKLAPYAVEGIFQIHQSASTETKTQLATDALSLAAGIAGAILPGEEPLIALASAGIQATISALAQAKAGGLTLTPPPVASVAPAPVKAA